ncbi:hypothetical protein V1264_000649 [Littorina saxatilis]|uniref:Uncharacterized protein n=1 Tax=Littorina saxatilis TaxID=31220 RepID=A0AAN9BZM2_9CAEN
MGSVCSSGNSRGKGKTGKNRRGSLTSSSDVAVDMGQAKRVTIGGGEGGNTRSSYPDTCSNSGTSTIPDSCGRGSGPQSSGPGMPVRADIGCPNCVVPICLNSMPWEMQNLLMGRWPVPPTPDSRVLRLFVAAEEMGEECWSRIGD